uniref:glutathione S-transferase C-terminal domain-containing protein n=1 Tax=uncultured Sphingomonas sp. TaxID=158754 RepID=UPI0035C96FBA
MKLYYCPATCSLAAHITLAEGGAAFDSESVDLKSKLTRSGADFDAIAPKGYVPALVLDDGEVVSENIAVLDYLAGLYPHLGLAGPRGRTRLLETLAFISTEIHKSYKPFWRGGSEADKAAASAYITKRLTYLADRVGGTYLLGDQPTVADFYLFVMLLWARRFDVAIPAALLPVREALAARPAVQATLLAEGIR